MVQRTMTSQSETMERAEVLVCVTDQPHCSQWIARGNAFARTLGTTMRVLCVAPDPKEANQEALAELFSACQENGATMTVAFSVNAIPTILRVAKRQGVQHIVMGCPSEPQSRSIVFQVASLLPNARVYIPEGEGLRPAVDADQLQLARRA